MITKGRIQSKFEAKSVPVSPEDSHEGSYSSYSGVSFSCFLRICNGVKATPCYVDASSLRENRMRAEPDRSEVIVFKRSVS